MLKIIKEDLIDHVKEYDAVLVAANLYSSMLEGFAYDVKSQYPYVYEDNLKFPYGDTSKYGTVVESTREDQPIFALCYIFAINTNPKTIKCTLNYEALENCLKVVNVLYKNKHIISPNKINKLPSKWYIIKDKIVSTANIHRIFITE